MQVSNSTGQPGDRTQADRGGAGRLGGTATALSDAEAAAVLRKAKMIWADREHTFPKFVRQTWEQGTQLARDATVIQALQEMGFK